MNPNFDPISLAGALALLALLPIAAILTTSFIKIAVVLMLVRNALGVQQAPPNMALYALALILSAYVMGPVFTDIAQQLQLAAQSSAQTGQGMALQSLLDGLAQGIEPLKAFMLRHSDMQHRDFFMRSAHLLWGPEAAAQLKPDNLLVLVPAFLVTELTSAFKIGFLLYLPFVIIDLIVSNILLALGMMMVSPVTISLPFKLFLFVMVDGWSRLIQGLVLSYA
ncbi:type III secretion system export apparatus subunit SctR [Alcaligenes endophyticus]|uniref:Type III secretion system export apparatus subunit SctR n=1 Tax=Alcaligenes endophyticus TaxID=1929088 RepID=A0ABT8EFK9_9BURK|nr:type III secretion system export apparatus subunit SctR [Alcaligenes endophyticus]MCX5590281.1 type III secretion system export apparatus subunit SctR [Alcaligenes endophyticus]MDN4120055.1 type III secretion system export apparatus subunit SctR [Alcaligenes endophyticus]